MTDLGSHEEHGTGVLAGRHAGTTSDAGSGIHGHLGIMLRDRDHVGIGDAARGGADVTARLDDLVEGRAIHDQVTDDRERLCAPWLNPDLISVVELAHVQLAGGDGIVVAMRATVDIQSTHAADTLTAVIVEAHRMSDMVVDQLLVEDVEHLQERAIRRDVLDGIGLEVALGGGVFLAPNMQSEIHFLAIYNCGWLS